MFLAFIKCCGAAVIAALAIFIIVTLAVALYKNIKGDKNK